MQTFLEMQLPLSASWPGSYSMNMAIFKHENYKIHAVHQTEYISLMIRMIKQRLLSFKKCSISSTVTPCMNKNFVFIQKNLIFHIYFHLWSTAKLFLTLKMNSSCPFAKCPRTVMTTNRLQLKRGFIWRPVRLSFGSLPSLLSTNMKKIIFYISV